MLRKNKWLVVIALALLFMACDLESETQTTTYTLSFDINGGYGPAPDSLREIKAGERVYLPKGESLLNNSGDVFGGWHTERGYGALYAGGSEFFMPKHDTTLYAFWNSNTTFYTVSYDVNGATSGPAPESEQIQSGSSVALPSGSGFSKSGFTFGGWNTNASGTGTNYNASASYEVKRDVTFYAKWNSGSGTDSGVNNPDVTNCVVSFNANGGSGTLPSAQTIQANSSITLPVGSGLSRSGFTFGGWNTVASGTGINYPAGVSYTVTGNATFYAKWDPIGVTTYTVNFNANGGSGTLPTAQTVSTDTTISLPDASGLSRSGFTFSGWNTNSTGTGTNYNAGSSFTPTSNITLYAKWDAAIINYTVTYSINGGSGTAPTAQTIQAGSSVTLPSGSGLSRSSYTFGGWNTNTAGTGTNYNAGSSFTPTSNITLYAKWNSNYTITFNINGGSGTVPTTQTVQAGSSITLPSGSGLSRSGYTFGGWNTNSSGTGTKEL